MYNEDNIYLLNNEYTTIIEYIDAKHVRCICKLCNNEYTTTVSSLKNKSIHKPCYTKIHKIHNSLSINDNENILEIGPGLGALTSELLAKNINLTVVEYDQKFVNFLNNCYSKNKNLTVIKGNFLTYKDYSFSKLIGNLPYYITTEIIEHILKDFYNFKEGVFMVQNEALNRILSLKGKDYNALNIMINYGYDVKKLFLVSKNSFFPMPNVDSIVFKIVRKENSDQKFNLSLLKVSKTLFKLRRKTIYNNLKTIINDENMIKNVLNSVYLKENMRAEELSVNDFTNLTKELLKLNIISL